MSKSLAASKQLMQTYLSELLTEEVEDKSTAQVAKVKEKQAQPVEELLNSINLPKVATSDGVEVVKTVKSSNKNIVKTKTENEKSVVTTDAETIESKVENKLARESLVASDAKGDLNNEVRKDIITTHKSSAAKQKDYRRGDFQAMFFDVAGLLIAVPLIELGGIHTSEKTTALMGKPDWFKGIMLHRDEKVSVVDTALWVMPEKCNDKLISSLNYKYIIMLNDSSWGLTAERLVDTVTLKQEDVKWLDSPSKRPWLAGLVKDRMCALLDVDSLIKLLEKGANITQE